MTGRHDVHVCPSADGYEWQVVQGGRTLSSHRTQSTAITAGRRVARRDHVELAVHGRDGQIRAKDSYGRESAVLDSAR